jgi:hypothetical protein
MMVSHRREASSLRTLSNGFGTRRITRRYFLGRVSEPLADPYRKELGPPLGLPDNSSTETSCSLSIEGSMTCSTLPPRGEATNGRTNQNSRHPSTVLLLRAKARGAALTNHAKGSNRSTEDQIEPITPTTVENKSLRRSQLLLHGLGGYTRQVCSRAPIENQNLPLLKNTTHPHKKAPEPPNKYQSTSLECSGATVGCDN